MKVSIIIPTYNGSGYIAETLNSIAAQSVMPFEVVISDDESNDNTVDIIQNYSKSSSLPIKLIEHKRNGISANYFNALNHTAGEIVIVGDHDDIWLPNKLELIHNVFCQYEEVSIISSDSEIVDASLRRTGKTLRGNAKVSRAEASSCAKDDFLKFLIGLRLDAHTLAFRATVTNVLADTCFDGIENYWFEDKIAAVAMSIGRLKLMPESLTLYRQHSSQHVGYRNPSMQTNLHRDYKAKIQKLEVIKTMLGTNTSFQLFGKDEAQRRINMIDQYIDFIRIRNPGKLSFSVFPRMLMQLANGTYNKFTRNQMLSFLKDTYLLMRKVV